MFPFVPSIPVRHYWHSSQTFLIHTAPTSQPVNRAAAHNVISLTTVCLHGLYCMDTAASSHFVTLQLLYYYILHSVTLQLQDKRDPGPSWSTFQSPLLLEAEDHAPNCTTSEQAINSSYSCSSPTWRPLGQLKNKALYLNKTPAHASSCFLTSSQGFCRQGLTSGVGCARLCVKKVTQEQPSSGCQGCHRSEMEVGKCAIKQHPLCGA